MTSAERAALDMLLRIAREDAIARLAPEAGVRDRIKWIDEARATMMKEVEA